MTAEIQRLIAEVPVTGSIEDLGVVVDQLRDIYQLQHVVYHATHLGAEFAATAKNAHGGLAGNVGFWWIEDGQLATTTYSAAWIARYLDAGYVRIDPVVEAARGAYVPIDWKTLDWSSKRRKAFLREAMSAGIGNQGYTIPVRGPNSQFAMFTLNKSCSDEEWERFKENYNSDLLIISHYYHQKVAEVVGVSKTQKTMLSSREHEALKGLSLGKNRATIAHDLGVSENTLRVYIDSARHKLGALNTAHAVAISISKGLVSI